MCSLRTCQYALRQKLPEAGFVGLWRHFAVLYWRYWLGFLRTECGCTWLTIQDSTDILYTNGDELKNLDTTRSSSLAGMFSVPLDSFSDSQKFLPYAFKSLLVLYRVLFDFCSCKNFSISTSSLLVASSAGLKFANVCSFYLPASSWRSNFFIFFVCIFLRTTRLFCGQDQF